MTEPVEFEIGTAKVKIEIEDENAKYPLGWAMLADEKLRGVAGAGWTTFCEWMGYSSAGDRGSEQGPGRDRRDEAVQDGIQGGDGGRGVPANLRNRITRPTPGRAPPRRSRRTVSKKPVSAEEQLQQQNKEFAKLFHSSMLNTALLSRPSIESDSRKESALKYLGLWGDEARQHQHGPPARPGGGVDLRQAFQCPQDRRGDHPAGKIKPVADVNEIKKAVLGTPTRSRLPDFLTTTSTVFTIRVTAISGAARATARRRGEQGGR